LRVLWSEGDREIVTRQDAALKGWRQQQRRKGNELAGAAVEQGL
jgi:hypothetical protein